MENKTGKYFKYAFGEIILVVIGILIAIQVNNWNEQRLQTQKTTNYLESFAVELESNVTRMTEISDRARIDLKITLKVLTDLNDETKTIDNEYMYHTRLLPIFKTELETSVLEDMLSSGVLDNLPNSNLKKQIFSVKSIYLNYDENYVNARSTWDNYLLPYLNTHINVTNLWDSLSVVKMPKLKFENNLNAFVNNKEFANILSSRMRMLANMDNMINRDKKKIKALISDIYDQLSSN